jgi:hypothetical protein
MTDHILTKKLLTDQQIEEWAHGAASVLKMPAGNGGPDISVPALGSGMYIGYLSKELREYRDEIERLREVLTIPLITPEASSSALFIRVLSEHEKGQPVNGQDLINALMWRIGNQRREIARLQAKRAAAEPEAPLPESRSVHGMTTIPPEGGADIPVAPVLGTEKQISDKRLSQLIRFESESAVYSALVELWERRPALKSVSFQQISNAIRTAGAINVTLAGPTRRATAEPEVCPGCNRKGEIHAPWCTEKSNSPQAPIAKIRVWAHLPPDVTLYAPGLPPGEHDVYCEPMSVAPALESGEGWQVRTHKASCAMLQVLGSTSEALCDCGAMKSGEQAYDPTLGPPPRPKVPNAEHWPSPKKGS